jgi:hypothetical protein
MSMGPCIKSPPTRNTDEIERADLDRMTPDRIRFHAAQEIKRIARLARNPFLCAASQGAQLIHVTIHVRHGPNL